MTILTSDPNGVPRPFVVDGWVVDPGLHTICRGSTTVRLEPKALQLLIFLAVHAGETVAKDALIKSVWPDTFVSDQVLTNAVSDLRHAFGASRGSGFIQTIPKGGYRLTASVSEAPSDGRRSPLRWKQPAFVAALVGVVLASAYAILRGRLAPGKRQEIRSMAVLPFVNMSGDASQEYFADGMTDELITELSMIDGLRVISRTSVMTYKRGRRTVPQIAQELGVDGIVEGAVMRDGHRVRITIQLIDARSDQHLWSQRYDTDVRNILATQAGVARDIAHRIRTTLDPMQDASARRSSRSVVPAAYEAYLKGRFYAAKWKPAMFPKAIHEFETAVTLDPAYAEAHAGLAYAYFLTATFCEPPACRREAEYVKQSRAAAARAVELDDTLGVAHAMLGTARWYDEWDRSAAEAELRRARDLDPHRNEVLLHYANYLTMSGRHAAAVSVMEQVMARDPLSQEALLIFSVVLRNAGHYDRAIAQLRKILEIDPESTAAYRRLATLYDLKGMPAQAIDATVRANGLAGRSSANTDGFERLASQGYEAILRAELEQLQRAGGSPFRIAALYGRLSDRENALRWLEQSYREHNTAMLSMMVHPYLASLRTDRRFQEIARHIGFGEERSRDQGN